MHVIILLNRVSSLDSAGDLDVLRQCVAVEEALWELGHTTGRVCCTMDLEATRTALTDAAPDLVFNLVESLGGTDRLMPVAALLLESAGIPFTGSGSLSILTTSHKLGAKQRMQQADLPTPAWLTETDSVWRQGWRSGMLPEQAIIKAISEHASLGITDASVVSCRSVDPAEIAGQIATRSQELGTPHFAEQFIDGREFNLSLLAAVDGPEVLPPAEIEFVDFAPDKPRIVGHNAKWVEAADEYRQTPRRFDFPAMDLPLLDELKALARRCWETFDLHGYARVDFRVDPDGQPWILEINANPCLSPDAGFAAAASRARLRFVDVIERIVHDAVYPGIAG